jgi:hypothetical protein
MRVYPEVHAGMMLRVFMIIASASILFYSTVRAAQIIPTGVEYTNDTIAQGGQLQACIITTAITNYPAPEVVNFQLLVIQGRPAFKVTGGEINWAQQSMVTKRIAEADFSTAQFNHPSAFTKSITPEGQFLAVLTDPNPIVEYLGAFLKGGYSIRFRRDDVRDERVYYIQQSPPPEVSNTFSKCVDSMLGTNRDRR